MMEVDSGRQREFESKLSEAMQQLRQEHEGQIQQYKEELEKTYNSKVSLANLSCLFCFYMCCIDDIDLTILILPLLIGGGCCCCLCVCVCTSRIIECDCID